jgi:hypothetical protein
MLRLLGKAESAEPWKQKQPGIGHAHAKRTLLHQERCYRRGTLTGAQAVSTHVVDCWEHSDTWAAFTECTQMSHGLHGNE